MDGNPANKAQVHFNNTIEMCSFNSNFLVNNYYI